MPIWEFEPGHTQIEFRCRHMMVAWVSGYYKNIAGSVSFDHDDPASAAVAVTIPARDFSSGEPIRDEHLRSADFLDCERCPSLEFRSSEVKVVASNEYEVVGNLTIRAVTHPAMLCVVWHGKWQTPYWEDGVDKGPITRIGFTASTKINRHDFGVSWNSALDRGGVVVGSDVHLRIDVEALSKP